MKVYIIQNKHTMIIHGCFKDLIKAQNLIKGNDDFEIIRCDVG